MENKYNTVKIEPINISEREVIKGGRFLIKKYLKSTTTDSLSDLVPNLPTRDVLKAAISHLNKGVMSYICQELYGTADTSVMPIGLNSLIDKQYSIDPDDLCINLEVMIYIDIHTWEICEKREYLES